MFITIIGDLLSLDEDIVQHSPLISRRIYFVKFPVNLLKPNPQSEASILSSVHLRASVPKIQFSVVDIFQIPSFQVVMTMASYFVKID